MYYNEGADFARWPQALLGHMNLGVALQGNDITGTFLHR